MIKKIKMISLTAALLTAVSFVLPSCSHASGDVLWYQKYPLTAEIKLDSGSVVAEIYEDGTSKVTVSSPEELDGVSFFFGRGEHISAGDAEIPLSPGGMIGLRAVAGAFLLNENDISSVNTDGSVSTVSYHGELGDYLFTYDKDGTPMKFDFRCESTSFSAEVIKLTPAENGSSAEK